MDTLSWTEVDDLRARLAAPERERFDAELRTLTSADDDDVTGSAFADLLERWRGIIRPARTAPFRLGIAPGWMARLTAAH